jgi:hypothetical protein
MQAKMLWQYIFMQHVLSLNCIEKNSEYERVRTYFDVQNICDSRIGCFQRGKINFSTVFKSKAVFSEDKFRSSVVRWYIF